MVSSESVVVYNPSFGGASVICGGADADMDNKLNNFEIHRIAFYRARFGEIEYVDVNVNDCKEIINEFAEILGEDAYEEYFESEIKRQGDERRRQDEYKKIEERYSELLNYLGRISWYEESLQKYNAEEDRQRWMKVVIFSESNTRIPDKIDGSKLQKIIDDNHISIKELSDKLKVAPTTIRNWIKEKTNPSVGALIDLTEVFNCSISDIVKGKVQKTEKIKFAKKRKKKR